MFSLALKKRQKGGLALKRRMKKSQSAVLKRGLKQMKNMAGTVK